MKKRSFISSAPALFASAALAAFCACAGAPSRPAALPPYLSAAAVETVLIGPSPAPGSVEDKKDLAVLHEWQRKRTPRECAAAQAQSRASYEEFFGPAGPFPVPLAPAVAAFFGRLHHELYTEVSAVKGRYKRPRPYLRDTSLSPCLKTWPDDSYPSGHAANSRFFADALAELEPGRKEEFLALADQAALNRVIGGVHHPSDIEAGKLLGDRLFAEYMKVPAFRADLEGLRKYLKK